MLTKRLLLAASHLAVLAIGFAAGIYVLPILTAPPAPSATEVTAGSPSGASWQGEFRRDLRDSDAFHWGEGTVLVGPHSIGLVGRLAPGPDYRLYLSTTFVDTEADFLRLKAGMRQVGEVKTFENFLVRLPAGVDPGQYTTVIVWCERFGQFISAARYR
jgi:hypothetical protein